MRKMLILTTLGDRSAATFLAQEEPLFEVDFAFFEMSDNFLHGKLVQNNYDFIYIRDPFNNEDWNDENIAKKWQIIWGKKKTALLVDSLASLDDIYLEDKWKQHAVMGEFMPKTKLLESFAEIDPTKHIIKKRIATQCRGIFFDAEALTEMPENYILQEKLDIVKEWRVYGICKEVIETAGVKTPKTINQKNKFVRPEIIPPEVKVFAQKILERSKFDFLGLDVGQTADGKLYLFEANRSCLFNFYFTLTGENISGKLYKKLIEKQALLSTKA